MAGIVVGHKLDMEIISLEFEKWKQQKVTVEIEDNVKIILNPVPKKTNKTNSKVVSTITEMITKHIDSHKEEFYELFKEQIEEEIKKLKEHKQIHNNTQQLMNKNPSENVPNQNLLNFTKTFINQLNNNLSTTNKEEFKLNFNKNLEKKMDHPFLKDEVIEIDNENESEYVIKTAYKPDIKWNSFKNVIASCIEDSVENKDIKILEIFTKTLGDDIEKCSNYVDTLKQGLEMLNKCKEKITKEIENKIKEDDKKSDDIFNKYL